MQHALVKELWIKETFEATIQIYLYVKMGEKKKNTLITGLKNVPACYYLHQEGYVFVLYVP